MAHAPGWGHPPLPVRVRKLRGVGSNQQIAAENDLERAGVTVAANRCDDRLWQLLESIDRLRLEADLRKAIERNELSMHFQPQVDTINGSVVGAEALLRWQHPEFGDLPPNQFIAMAEEMGYSDQLGDWVVEEACSQLAAFAAKELKLPRVAINVAAPQFKPELRR